MKEKLELMRKKKQEYLQYQRHMALQRMQQLELETKMRQEEAKQVSRLNFALVWSGKTIHYKCKLPLKVGLK